MGEYVSSTNAKFDKSFISCGVMEVHHLPKGTKQTIFAIANALYHKANPRPVAYFMFSDVVEVEGPTSRGQALFKELVSMSKIVGEVTSPSPSVNPKTGNIIRVVLVRIDHETFRKWYQDELANRVTEA